MRLTFKQWLFKQKERQDQIGRLALAMLQIEEEYLSRSRRKADEHKKWADIVTRHGEPKHVLAFNQAWREYQTAMEAVAA